MPGKQACLQYSEHSSSKCKDSASQAKCKIKAAKTDIYFHLQGGSPSIAKHVAAGIAPCCSAAPCHRRLPSGQRDFARRRRKGRIDAAQFLFGKRKAKALCVFLDVRHAACLGYGHHVAAAHHPRQHHLHWRCAVAAGYAGKRTVVHKPPSPSGVYAITGMRRLAHHGMRSYSTPRFFRL